MDKCLKDIVNVVGCPTAARPLVYLNVLPGISIKSLDMLSSEDQATFVGVVDDILSRAAMKIETDLQALVGVRLNHFFESFCLGRAVTPPIIDTTTGGLQGIVFDFPQSPYLILHLQEILFFSPLQQEIKIFVIDVAMNAMLAEYTFQVEPGDNRFAVNEDFWPRRNSGALFVGFDSPGVSFYETRVAPCHPNCHCAPSCADVRNSVVFGYNGVESTKRSFGLGVIYSLECSFLRFICFNAPFFKNVMLYAAGVEFVLETLGSTRLNRFTTTKHEELLKLQSIYENYYVKNLKNITKTLNFCDNCCFHCEPAVEYTYARP